MSVKILLIDNYDSFTYNLVHYFEELGAQISVYRNDAMSADEFLKLGFDAIVISPGPKAPKDAGVSMDIIAKAPNQLPILGVCLGHQAIGEIMGGKVLGAKAIIHGKTSLIKNNGKGLFKGLPECFNVTRYHSLAIEPETCPDILQIDVTTKDGEIMAISHKSRPIYGVQFHPESIACEYGHEMLDNFLKIVKAQKND